MYQIALCDDRTDELDKAEYLLRCYQKERSGCMVSIRRFLGADELLLTAREHEYVPDLVLMDIFMPGKLGVDAARELREMGVGCRIVFLTVSKDYALEAFRVDAVQYLLKPVAKDDLFQVLDRVWKKAEEDRKKYLLLRIDSRLCRIPLPDIVYIEAQKKCQCMYLSDGTQHLLRLTMAKLFGMLCGYEEFVKAGVSYIVNLRHVESISVQKIQLDSGKKIYLPRGAYPALKEQYFHYYCAGEEEC